MDNQRNMLIAVVLSVVILLAWQFFVEIPRMERERALQEAAKQEETLKPPAPEEGAPVPEGPAKPAAPATAGAKTTAEVVAEGNRVAIESPRIRGSISLKGGRVDDVELTDYHVTTDPKSPLIELLRPQGTANPYFAEFGWVAAGGGPALPGADTQWTADGDKLTPDNPVTLTWDSGEGLVFSRRIALDNEYMFTVTQRVTNTGGAPVTLYPYSLVSRTGTPKTLGFFILHEGPIAVINGALQEYGYDDLREDKRIDADSAGGWIGITDKYWLAAVIPDPEATVKMRFSYAGNGEDGKYQADFLGGAKTLAPDSSAETTSRLFAGAKEVRLLDHYEETLHIEDFDLAVDFGWFYFLTKPIFYALNIFHGWLGNFGLAILLLTVIIKIVFFPLANKSYRAMSKMKKLQPQMLEMREKYADDRQRMNQEMMELYKREKVNPAAGCLPILVQIPVFFALYKVLFVTIEMRHTPFYGWIKDLSAPDPTSVLNLFGLIPWQAPDFLSFAAIGIWPILMGITMYLQQKLNPPPPDPVQARIFMLLPIVFTFLLAHFPAGLVIYWAWNNALSIAQQWVIMRQVDKEST